MIDRVKNLVHRFSSETLSREAVEAAAFAYTREGRKGLADQLVKDGMPAAEAETLSVQMEREYISTSRELLIYYSILGLLFAVLFYMAILMGSIVFSILFGIILFRNLRKIFRFVKKEKIRYPV